MIGFYNIETEEVILGSILMDAKCMYEVAPLISVDEMFYFNKHKAIWNIIRTLHETGAGIDTISVMVRLNRGEPEQDARIENGVLIGKLEQKGTASGLDVHCAHLKEMYMRRELRLICQKGLASAEDEFNDSFECYDAILSNLDTLNRQINRVKVKSFSELTNEVVNELKEAANNKSYATGLKTGIYQLDEATGGWQNTDLIILAARPAMGKTAFTVDDARKQAKENGIAAGFFSIEMADKQLNQRILAQEVQVDLSVLRRGGLRKHEWQQLDSLVPDIAQLPIHICDTGGISINELCSIAKNWKIKHNIGILYIDYLQLITADGKRNGNREQEISSISRRLKGLAKELNIPIICLSQLSRKCEERANKRPILSDLRESGAIEQDADIVIFLYRDGYYTNNEEDDSVEIIIAKQRNGDTGTAMARMHKPTQRFLNPSDNIQDYVNYSEPNSAAEEPAF